MKKVLMIIVGMLIALGIGAAVFAATGRTKAGTTSVTVAVSGFHCQACPDSLQKDLAKLSGVNEVKATLKPAQVTARLDERKITASQFVQAIATHPQAMDPKKTYGATLVVYIDAEMCSAQKTMCSACFTEIPKVLKTVKGVSDVTLDKTGKVALVSFAKGARVSTSAIANALAKSSFKFTTSFTAPKTAAKAAPQSTSGMACH